MILSQTLVTDKICQSLFKVAVENTNNAKIVKGQNPISTKNKDFLPELNFRRA